jgi:S1-C subfamily serine protease
MESMRLVRLMVALLLVALGAQAQPAPLGEESAVRRALHAASVQLLPTGCAGVLAESPQLVLTARHCVDEARQTLAVRFSTGATRNAWIVATNVASDQAVLFLEDAVPIEPLVLVRRRQIPGTVLYFEGNPGRPRFQQARLDRIGRCPSLPDLPNALFTSIRGRPGDSGAPLVDGAARVVGLVHGGAQCRIATPADSLVRLVDGLLERDLVELTRARLTAADSWWARGRARPGRSDSP